MNFKELVKYDNEHVFINFEEHGKIVTIEGEEITVVIDNDSLKERQLKGEKEGLATARLLFYVRVEDMPFDPFPDQTIMFDNGFYYIDEASEDDGIYTIILEVPQS